MIMFDPSPHFQRYNPAALRTIYAARQQIREVVGDKHFHNASDTAAMKRAFQVCANEAHADANARVLYLPAEAEQQAQAQYQRNKEWWAVCTMTTALLKYRSMPQDLAAIARKSTATRCIKRKQADSVCTRPADTAKEYSAVSATSRRVRHRR